MRLGRPIKRESGARTRPELDTLRGARRSHDVRDIAAHRVAHADRADLVTERREGARVEDRSEIVGGHSARSVDAKDVVFLFGVRVTELEHEKESVELRLGERKRSLELDRVLRRDDAERRRERVCRLVHRDLPLLHRFEQAGLRAWRRTVDLVDEDDVRHERTGPVLERLRPLIEDRDAGDVRRYEVRCALDPSERQRERTRDRAREGGLPHSGDIVEQYVSFDQKRREQLLGRRALSDDDVSDLFDEAACCLLDRRHARLGRFERGDAAIRARAPAADRACTRERQREGDECCELVEDECDGIHHAQRERTERALDDE